MTHTTTSSWKRLPILLMAASLFLLAVTFVWIQFRASDPALPEATEVESNTSAPVLTRPAFVDRNDPGSTAYAVLYAFKTKDFQALPGLVLETNRQQAADFACLDDTSRARLSFYQNWRWQSVDAWNGQIGEIRYRHYVSANRDEYRANVIFGESGPDELLIVTLFREDGKWAFEDLHSPPRQSFNSGSRTFKQIPDPY